MANNKQPAGPGPAPAAAGELHKWLVKMPRPGLPAVTVEAATAADAVAKYRDVFRPSNGSEPVATRVE